jgi:hypothetical protein
MEDDWYPPSLDGNFTWVTPESPACPNCECCSEELCKLARHDDRTCLQLCPDKHGQVSVRDCPCCVLTVDERRAAWTRLTIKQGYTVRDVEQPHETPSDLRA